MATKARPTNRRTPPLRPTLTTPAPGDLSPGSTGRTPITISAYIIEQVRAGIDPMNAAGMVGVSPAEFTAWMREGVQQFARLTSGADWDRDFTPEQQDCAVFADGTIRAHSTHIARLSRLADQAANGQLPPRVITTTRDNGDGKTETTVRTESIGPDLDVVRWKLEKLEPTIYGNKSTVNVLVQDMTDTDSTADAVEARMREVAAALIAAMPAAPAAIDVTSSEVPDQQGEQHNEPDPERRPDPAGHGDDDAGIAAGHDARTARGRATGTARAATPRRPAP